MRTGDRIRFFSGSGLAGRSGLWLLPRHHLPLLQGPLDLTHPPADIEDVMHVDVLLAATGPNNQVARAEAQDVVAENIAALLLKHHPGGVVSGLAAADFQVY